MEHSFEELVFLEFFVENDNGHNITDIYRKTADSQQ